jgi:hypothetical protein
MKAFLIVLFLFVFSFSSFAQSGKLDVSDTLSYSSSIDPVTDTVPDISIFDDDTPIDLILKYDITSFIKNKMKSEYIDAELHIDYNGHETTKNIQLKARGNRRKEVCFFPPIYLNFKSDPLETSEMKGIKKIKMVTHCSTSKQSTAYLLKEFLVYKLYNILTDNSLRVRLLNITYIDTGKKKRNYEKYGFLIEPVELLTKRTNSTEIDGSVVRSNNLIEEDADLVALFNYMIGNTDWRFKTGHNMKFIKSLTEFTQRVIPIPYDFDYSGFVDTHYATPQEWTSIKDVKEREYTGYCREKEEYVELIELFNAKKDEMLQTIDSFDYLPENERNRLNSYINEFFNMAKRPDRLASTLRTQCRGEDF